MHFVYLYDFRTVWECMHGTYFTFPSNIKQTPGIQFAILNLANASSYFSSGCSQQEQQEVIDADYAGLVSRTKEFGAERLNVGSEGIDWS